jgi:diguanylate cyclase (GGDEF)-like protein/PAS domain S-box-containing protein
VTADSSLTIPQLLQQALDECLDGVALFDAKDRLLYRNPAFMALFDIAVDGGMTYEQLIRHCHDTGTLLDFGCARLDEWLAEQFKKRRQKPYRSYDLDCADGIMMVTESLSSDGTLLCTFSNRNRYTRLHHELDEKEQLLQQLLLHSSEAIVIYDLDNNFNIVEANAAALELFKYSREEIMSIDPTRLSAAVQPGNKTVEELGQQYLEDSLAGLPTAYEWLFMNAHGNVIPAEVRLVRMHKTGRNWIRCTITDISERQATQQKMATQERHLQYLRQYDTLTELPNRNMINEQLERAIDSARATQTKVALLCIDIDRFKLINDSLGYHIGDRYLINIGNALGRLVRGTDTVGRLGADEFAIILGGLSDTGIVDTKAQLILQEMSRAIRIDEHELLSTASIGIAIYPDNSADQDSLLRHADAAMHQAKQLGKNTFAHYQPELDHRMGGQLQLESDLRRALARNEFHLVFQPQIHAATGRIFAAEVLLRWTHPTRGFISPAEFIPLAEETGIITDIGQWVLEESLRQMQSWRKHGITLDYIAVNISPRQFSLARFVDTVLEVTQRCQLPPQCLQLELTENLLLESTAQTIDKLQRLSDSGFSVAIDDFGTGYSSLSYLKRFPLQKLKIDRSFVADVTKDPNDAAIVRAIIAMADSLNLNVIAEGVETAEQVAFLQALGCNEIQGFYYSKPLAVDAFVDFVKKTGSE